MRVRRRLQQFLPVSVRPHTRLDEPGLPLEPELHRVAQPALRIVQQRMTPLHYEAQDSR